MPSDAPTITTACPPEIAQLSAGKVDGRVRGSRRFHAIVAELTADLGGDAGLTFADRLTIRACASLTMSNEDLQRRQMQGEDIDHDALIRGANAAARMLSALKRKRAPTKGLTGAAALSAHLERKGATT
jgi:predicted methyltransferase MtxX (methanogen marker protein 4)